MKLSLGRSGVLAAAAAVLETVVVAVVVLETVAVAVVVMETVVAGIRALVGS